MEEGEKETTIVPKFGTDKLNINKIKNRLRSIIAIKCMKQHNQFGRAKRGINDDERDDSNKREIEIKLKDDKEIKVEEANDSKYNPNDYDDDLTAATGVTDHDHENEIDENEIENENKHKNKIMHHENENNNNQLSNGEFVRTAGVHVSESTTNRENDFANSIPKRIRENNGHHRKPGVDDRDTADQNNNNDEYNDEYDIEYNGNYDNDEYYGINSDDSHSGEHYGYDDECEHEYEHNENAFEYDTARIMQNNNAMTKNHYNYNNQDNDKSNNKINDETSLSPIHAPSPMMENRDGMSKRTSSSMRKKGDRVHPLANNDSNNSEIDSNRNDVIADENNNIECCNRNKNNNKTKDGGDNNGQYDESYGNSNLNNNMYASTKPKDIYVTLTKSKTSAT